MFRQGRERIAEFDDQHPWIEANLLPALDPDKLYLQVHFPGDQGGTMMACDRPAEDLCVELAERLQELFIKGLYWGANWPQCPIHRTHPLWAELEHGIAVWTCSTPPGYSRRIGDLASEASLES